MLSRVEKIAAAVIMLLLAAGCASNQPTQFPTEIPIITARVTNTTVPSPSPTQIPATATPLQPTSTPKHPTETPTPTPDVPFEKVSFTTEDGIEIAATLFGEGEPALIMLHMGAGGATQKSWHPFARLAAEQGFTALTVDLRGRGESGGKMHPPRMILDARAAVEFLQERNYQRFICLGASMGGTTCLTLAKEGGLGGFVIVSSTQSLGGDNFVSNADLSALSIPKMFIYGENDTSILSDMLSMSRNSAEPKQIIAYENAAHGTDLLLSPHGDDIRQQLLAFLDELR